MDLKVDLSISPLLISPLLIGQKLMKNAKNEKNVMRHIGRFSNTMFSQKSQFQNVGATQDKHQSAQNGST